MNIYKATQIGKLLSADLEDLKKGIESINSKIKQASENPSNFTLQLELFQMLEDFVEVVNNEVDEFNRNQRN